MIKVIEVFGDTDEADGNNRREASRIAVGAGMRPSGLSGYFRNGLLQPRGDARWITERGKDRLRELRKSRNLPTTRRYP